MASVKVLKPTQPVNILNTPIAPKPYTLSYYEWLSTQGRRVQFYDNRYVSSLTSINIMTLTNKEVFFITSITLGGSFGDIIPIDGLVYLQGNSSKKIFALLWLENINNAAIPIIESKNYSIPLRIDGSEALDMIIEANLNGWCSIQGFIVDKSLLFF